MIIITVSNVPAGYSAAMSAHIYAVQATCDAFQWAHGPSTAVSQKCYMNLPAKVGYWTMVSTATLTKPGATPLVYSTTSIVKTSGQFTTPVSATVRNQITQCYNTTPNVWLTFDDGYSSQANLNSILATLKAYNVRGRFFLVGSWARANPAMMNQIRAAGHYVENHTSTHKILNQATPAVANSEIVNGQRPNARPALIRPPGGAGSYTNLVYNLATSHGYRVCYWGSDTRDWSGVSAATIVNKVIHGDAITSPARAGDSILMHLSNTQSRYALPAMIKALRAKGLVLDKLR